MPNCMTKIFIAKSINLSSFMAKSLHQIFSLPNQLKHFNFIGVAMRKSILHNLHLRRQHRLDVDVLVQVKATDQRPGKEFYYVNR